MSKNTARFETNYLDSAWSNPTLIIDQARPKLKGIKYDTMVGTGMSGAILVPVLARALRKKFLIVRKDGDHSHHAKHGGKLFGELGQRWLFVDDMVDSGLTYQRVRDGVLEAIQETNKCSRWGCVANGEEDSCEHIPHDFASEHVGVYEYENETYVPWGAGRWNAYRSRHP